MRSLVAKEKSSSRTRRIMTEVAMMAGWAFSVVVRVELGPLAMRAERGRCKIESVSSRNWLQVRGKAESHGSAMPTR